MTNKTNQLLHFLLVFYSLELRNIALCQQIGFGFCPRVSTIKDFNVTQYVGTWYEIEKYPHQWETTMSCVSIQVFIFYCNFYSVLILTFLIFVLKLKITVRYYERDGDKFSADIQGFEKM